MALTPTDVIDALQALLAKRDDLNQALQAAIKDAELPQYFSDLETFYDFVATSILQIPQNSNSMLQMDLAYYYVVTISKDHILAKDPEFQKWNLMFHNAWGHFLNGDASTGHLASYTNDERFQIDEYQHGPSGWQSFNQFFARQPKPGKRPIAEHCDPTVVVSPCDCMLADIEMIDAHSKVSFKGVECAISELLADSQYSDAFAGGLYISSFLQIWNYHRYHTPAAGKVLEAKKIPGYVGMTIAKIKDKNGAEVLEPVPADDFQFTQDRGLVVMETTDMGLVALLPVGMAQISSVVLTAEKDVELYKGEEFGYFQFGGSNVIMLTQKDRFEPDPKLIAKLKSAGHDIEKLPTLLQGQAIGKGLPAA